MNPNSSWTAKLELSSSLKNVAWNSDAWFVEWIRIMGTEHAELSCKFNVWLEHKTAQKAACQIKGNDVCDANHALTTLRLFHVGW